MKSSQEIRQRKTPDTTVVMPLLTTNEQAETSLAKKIAAIGLCCFIISGGRFLIMPVLLNLHRSVQPDSKDGPQANDPVLAGPRDTRSGPNVHVVATSVLNHRNVQRHAGASGDNSALEYTEQINRHGNSAQEAVNKVDEPNKLLTAIKSPSGFSRRNKVDIIKQMLAGVSDKEIRDAIEFAQQQIAEGQLTYQEAINMLERLKDPIVLLFEAGRISWPSPHDLHHARNAFISKHSTLLADVPFLEVYLGLNGIDLGCVDRQNIDLAIADLKNRMGFVDTLNLCGPHIDTSKIQHIASELGVKKLVSDHKRLKEEIIAPGAIIKIAGNLVQLEYIENSPTNLTWRSLPKITGLPFGHVSFTPTSIADIAAIVDYLPGSSAHTLTIRFAKSTQELDYFQAEKLMKAVIDTPSLYSLRLPRLDDKALYIIMEYLPQTTIRKLDLSGSLPKGDAALALIARKLAQTNLLDLKLSFETYPNNNTTPINTLTPALPTSKLIRLSCNGCRVDSDFWNAVAASNLRSVTLRDSHVTERENTHVEATVNAILGSKLTHIDLQNSFKNFICCKRHRHYSYQVLTEEDPGFTAFAKVLSKDGLKHINLSKAPLTDPFFSSLCELPSSLRRVDLSRLTRSESEERLIYGATDQGAQTLANILANSHQLKYLNFRGHKLQDTGFKALVRAASDIDMELVTGSHASFSWANGFLEGKKLKLLA